MEDFKDDTEIRALARMSADTLRRNFKAVKERARTLQLLPMIKANGYGHGDVWTAQTLEHEQGLYAFGVATFEEAVRVRNALKKAIPILVFSDCDPWSDERLAKCERFQLTPVLSSSESLRYFLERGHHRRISFQIKFNTGMNRLGLDPFDREHWLTHPLLFEPESRLSGVLSHLHSADVPHSRASLQQFRLSRELFSNFKNKRPTLHTHLGNSTALLLRDDWKLETFSEVVRPGIALYGVSPVAKRRFPKIEPVMELHARILQLHTLQRGDGVGYAHRYRAQGKETAASIAIGYADGLPRSLSEKGRVLLGKTKCPVLGRVSMDLISIKVPNSARPSQWVTLWGKNASIWEVATAAGTIPYELWTKLTERVRRVYL